MRALCSFNDASFPLSLSFFFSLLPFSLSHSLSTISVHEKYWVRILAVQEPGKFKRNDASLSISLYLLGAFVSVCVSAWVCVCKFFCYCKKSIEKIFIHAKRSFCESWFELVECETRWWPSWRPSDWMWPIHFKHSLIHFLVSYKETLFSFIWARYAKVLDLPGHCCHFFGCSYKLTIKLQLLCSAYGLWHCYQSARLLTWRSWIRIRLLLGFYFFFFPTYLLLLDWSCDTVVRTRPTDLEAVGLNPTECCWAFPSSSLSNFT